MRNSLIALAATLSFGLLGLSAAHADPYDQSAPGDAYHGGSYDPAYGGSAAGIDLGDGPDLSGYNVVIGDTGNWSDNWWNSDSRVYVRVRDGWGRRHEEYFDNLASAFFVLREKYGTVRLQYLEVPDYASGELIDGARAWYVWDYSRYDRGGVPLVLSFASYYDARREAGERGNAEVMSFSTVIYNLKRWSTRCRDERVVYWRGWYNGDAGLWDNAWRRRWDGWDWDRHSGWSIVLNIGGRNRDRDGNRERDGDRGTGGRIYGPGYTRGSESADEQRRREEQQRQQEQARERARQQSQTPQPGQNVQGGPQQKVADPHYGAPEANGRGNGGRQYHGKDNGGKSGNDVHKSDERAKDKSKDKQTGNGNAGQGYQRPGDRPSH